MSLPPSPDGFARLQARMEQGQPQARVVFWRNPDIQRYMAVAACLLLICLFGWRYVSTQTPPSDQTMVAVHKRTTSPVPTHSDGQLKADPEGTVAATQPASAGQKVPKQTDSELGDFSPAERSKLAVGTLTNRTTQVARADRPTHNAKTVSHNIPAVVPTEVEPTVEKRDVAAADKPAPVAERVLVVTIAEPEALAAARQAVQAQSASPEVKAVAAANEKPEKEPKPATLWQQMKRLKQGEVFARKDAGEDERGLLGRAYSGIKQTFDKEKSVKQ